MSRVLFTHNDHEQNIPLIKRDIVGQVPSGSRVTRLRYAYLSPFVHRKDWMSTVWWRGCVRMAKDSEVGGGSWGQMFHSIENYRRIFLLFLHPLHIVHAPFIIRSQTKFLLPLPSFLPFFPFFFSSLFYRSSSDKVEAAFAAACNFYRGILWGSFLRARPFLWNTQISLLYLEQFLVREFNLLFVNYLTEYYCLSVINSFSYFVNNMQICIFWNTRVMDGICI